MSLKGGVEFVIGCLGYILSSTQRSTLFLPWVLRFSFEASEMVWCLFVSLRGLYSCESSIFRWYTSLQFLALVLCGDDSSIRTIGRMRTIQSKGECKWSRIMSRGQCGRGVNEKRCREDVHMQDAQWRILVLKKAKDWDIRHSILSRRRCYHCLTLFEFFNNHT